MQDKRVTVIGMSYVGCTLTVGFGRLMSTSGLEISQEKIDAYLQGYDPTGEM